MGLVRIPANLRDFDIISLVDSPRGVLDDIAVAIGRHGLAPGQVEGMVICKEFPNRRSDYYHLIEDVEKVLGYRIRTLSVAGLLLLLWLQKTISELDIANGCVATRGSEGIASSFRPIVPHDAVGVLDSRYFAATK